jgi:hypothetical protein
MTIRLVKVRRWSQCQARSSLLILVLRLPGKNYTVTGKASTQQGQTEGQSTIVLLINKGEPKNLQMANGVEGL